MTDYVIPCDTVARLANVLRTKNDKCDQFFQAIRIDNGVAVTSNRTVIVAEKIAPSVGVIHLIAHPALIEQCRKEAPFASTVTITVNDMLKFAVAKTTLGYVHPGNCIVWSDDITDFNAWRSIVMTTKEPAKASVGGMLWDTENINNIAAASPSGKLVFETNIDSHNRPTVIRDINDYDWFAVFNPWERGGDSIQPATLPSWMVG